MNLTELLNATDRAGITFKATPSGLLVTPADRITNGMAEAIRRYQPVLLALHRGTDPDRGVLLMGMFLDGQLEQEDLGDDEPLPEPCSVCSSLEVWWDAWGNTRCEQCHPPEASRRLRQHARRIRVRGANQRHGENGTP